MTKSPVRVVYLPKPLSPIKKPCDTPSDYDTVTSEDEWTEEVEMLDEFKNPFKGRIGLEPYPLKNIPRDQDSEMDFNTLKDSLKKAKEALNTGKCYWLVKPNTVYPKSSKNTQIVIGNSPEVKRRRTMSGKKKPELKDPNLKKEK